MGIAARAPPAPARRGICWKAAGSIVVITDVVMPKMSGIELITKIKDRFGSDVAVIVVTAVNDRDSAMHALEKGAYQYMNKPFKHNELLVAVAAAPTTSPDRVGSEPERAPPSGLAPQAV